jgi:hypothetical protein
VGQTAVWPTNIQHSRGLVALATGQNVFLVALLLG